MFYKQRLETRSGLDAVTETGLDVSLWRTGIGYKVEMTRLGLARPEQRWAIGTLLGLVQMWGSILI